MQIPEPKRESGFTLIELLVVMIIISILMAVAIPTFLSQKNSAVKTQATANIKQVVNAIESCASQIPTGGYVDPTPGGINCTNPETLLGYEKSLKQVGIQNEALGADAVGSTQVAAIGSQGYLVQRVIKDGSTSIYFAEVHTEDGELLKLCSATSIPTTVNNQTVAAPVMESKTCKTGKW